MRKLLILMFLVVLIAGCAEEVVKKETTPAEMVIRIYFRGNVDSTLYKYYFVFATNPGIQLPNVNIPNAVILEPGEPYNAPDLVPITSDPSSDNITYYYENFFDTWVDSTRYKTGQFSIVIPQGYYPSSANETAHLSYNDNAAWSVSDGTAGVVLKMSFSIDQIRSGALTKDDNDRIYFNFITADASLPTAGLGGLMYDYLDAEASIINKSGAQISEYDTSNDEDKPAGADIVRWTVDIR